MRRHLISGPALENEPIDITPGTDDINTMSTDADLQDSLAEVSTMIQADEVSAAATDSALRVAEALEAMSASLEEIIEEGGLSEAGLGIVVTAADHMYQSVGFAEEPLAAAMESHADKTDRVSATRVALEGLKDGIKKVYDAIIAAINKAIDWVKGVFAKIFGGAAKSKAAVSKAQDDLQKSKDSWPEDGFMVESKAAVTNFHIGGKKCENLPAAMDKVKSTVDAVLGGKDNMNEKLAHAVEKNSSEEAYAVFSSATSVLTLTSPITNPSSDGLPDAPAGMIYKRSEELPGGFGILATLPDPKQNEKTDALLRLLVNARIEMTREAFPKTKPPEDKELKGVSFADAEKLLATAADVVKTISDHQAKLASEIASKKRVVQALTKLRNAGDEGDKAVIQLANSSFRFIDRPVAEMSTYGLRQVEVITQFVQMNRIAGSNKRLAAAEATKAAA
jgi:hypothetical protein